ncbi:MAG: peptidase M10 [Ferruginibacter sp.]
MGEAELVSAGNQLIIHAVIIIYGDAANDEVAKYIAADIAHFWNDANGTAIIDRRQYNVHFDITGMYAKSLTPVAVYENTDPRNNYFRIEEFATGNISFVDGLNSNTGYFKLDNLFHNSTTAAHEFGHSIGLDHPKILDIRGKGVPGIMYPRGTITDPPFQYDPQAQPHGPGGTMSPYCRRVLQKDIDDLRLHKLRFNKKGFAVIGDFTSVWHQKQLP